MRPLVSKVIAMAFSTSTGRCEFGSQLCTTGAWGACTGGVTAIAAETVEGRSLGAAELTFSRDGATATFT